MKNKQLLYLSIGLFAITFGSYVFIGFDSNLEKIINLIFYLASPALAVYFGLNAVKKYSIKSRHGKVFLAMVAGVMAWFIGDLLYDALFLIFNYDPFPSFIDFIYVAGYPLLMWGMIIEMGFFSVQCNGRKLIMTLGSSLLLMMIAFYVIFNFSYSADNEPLENFVNILYGLGDIILVLVSAMAFLIMSGIGKGRFAKPWLLFILAVLLMFAADCVYSMFFNEYDDYVLDIKTAVDLLYVATYLLIGNYFYQFSILIDDLQQRISKD